MSAYSPEINLYSMYSLLYPITSVRENVCNNSKNVKSHVFWILKKKTLKKRKKT